MKQDYCNIKVSVPWSSTGRFRDMRIWLIDHVDDPAYELGGLDPDNSDNRIIWFARKQDAVQFALRWA